MSGYFMSGHVKTGYVFYVTLIHVRSSLSQAFSGYVMLFQVMSA
jgi:hypothetical protein